MIERAKLLQQALRDETISDVASLPYAISFAEVRSLDLFCKDALERSLPDNPQYAAKWFVNEERGTSGPGGLLQELRIKRQVLEQAVHMVDAAQAGDVGTVSALPRAFQKIADPVSLFFEDEKHKCQDYDKNVFIMTRFQRGNKALESIDATIRNGLIAKGFIGHRADDRVYPNDRSLWDNVCTYMFCCKFGVAVLEDIIADEFNPNVALEYGFMRALGKPTLLLKEKRFRPRADILGTVWEEFDVLEIEATVSAAIGRWLNDMHP
jgi:hypothetical protein